MASTHYPELHALLRESALLNSVSSLLDWDQETYMPEAAAPMRSDQKALLATLAHERRTSPRLGELLAACESDKSLNKDNSESAANVREIRRDYDLATKLPKELVAEMAKVGSQAQEAWKHARQASDFKAFLPWLTKMFDLSRRKAECYGVPAGGELYDALLNEYEPGILAKDIEAIFTPLRKDLTDLVAQVAASKTKVSTKCLESKIDPAKQHAFGQMVLTAMGFDLNAGRLDTTAHPFCSGLAAGDTRLTTRYRDEKFTDALYGTMHEGGHGLYEQGLPKMDTDKGNGLFGQPLAEAVSLGIHESQSRMWENFVGRGKPFWKWALPKAQKVLSTKLKKYDVKDLFAAVNTVKPSLIRVEADEGTYNMHVMIRFELERAMLRGDLAPKDLPEAWKARYKDYLDIDVPDDRRGCLQDVHWSFGLIGYFPTYTLGNLYAAQFWDKINTDLPDLNKSMAKGNFGELREWLRTNIHRHGRRYRAAELCEKVTGKPPSPAHLLTHLRTKAEMVYGI